MFVAGKKYHYSTKGPVATCLYADDETFVLRYDGNRHSLSAKPVVFVGDGWKEYVEPKVEKVVRYVKRGLRTGTIYTNDEENRDSSFLETLGGMELTMTDGKLTDVKILEN